MNFKSPILLIGVGHLVGRIGTDVKDSTAYQGILSLVIGPGNHQRVGGGKQYRLPLRSPPKNVPRPDQMPRGHEAFLTTLHVHASLGGVMRATIPPVEGLADAGDQAAWQVVKNGKPLEPYMEMLPSSSLTVAALPERLPIRFGQVPAEHLAAATLGLERILDYELPQPIHVIPGETLQVQMRLISPDFALQYIVYASGWIQKIRNL